MVFLLSGFTTKDSGLTLNFWSVKMMIASTPFYRDIIGVLKKPRGTDDEVNNRGSSRCSLGVEASNLSDVFMKDSSRGLLRESHPWLSLERHSICPFLLEWASFYRPSFRGLCFDPSGFAAFLHHLNGVPSPEDKFWRTLILSSPFPLAHVYRLVLWYPAFLITLCMPTMELPNHWRGLG